MKTPDETNKQESKLGERLEIRQPKKIRNIDEEFLYAKLFLSKFSSELFCSWYNLSSQQEHMYILELIFSRHLATVFPMPSGYASCDNISSKDYAWN